MYFKILKVSLMILLTFAISACNQSEEGPARNPPFSEPTSIRVVSFNLKNAESDVEQWENRNEAVIQFLNKKNPDVIGLQEADELWVEYLRANINDYEYYGVGRDDGGIKGEATSILYKASKYNLIDSGTFWLSETPEQPSIGWDASTYRTCSYVLLENNNTGEKFAHFNTHLDHIGLLARRNGASLVLAKMKEMDIPAFITGDFNFLERSAVYKEIEKEGLLDSKHIAKSVDSYSTINWFIPDFDSGYTIDFVFVDPTKFDVNNYQVVASDLVEHKNNLIPMSDHYPIITDLALKK